MHAPNPSGTGSNGTGSSGTGTQTPTTVSVDSRTRFVVRRRLVHVLEVEDVHFATGRCVFLPDGHAIGGTPPGPDRISGLRVLATAIGFAERSPEKRLLIAGHTDTVGSDSSNLELSTARAENLQLYLSGQIDAWAEHCQENYGVDDYQAILKWIDITFGFDCDPGAIDGDFGDNTRNARDRFRKRVNEELSDALGFELARHVKQNDKDWRAYAHFYDRELARSLSITTEELVAKRASAAFTDPATLGCGEHWPVEAVGLDGHECSSNRRVDLLFFDEGEEPAIGTDTPPGRSIYDRKRFRAVYIPVDLDDVTELEIQLLDAEGFPMPGCEYRVVDGDEIIGSGAADDDGVAHVTAVDVSDVVRVEWQSVDGGSGFVFRSDYVVELSEDDEEASRQRLSNLGFDLHDEDPFNIEHFEQFFSLGLTGILSEIEELLGGWHDSGERPETGVDSDGVAESEGTYDLDEEDERPSCGCEGDDPFET